MNHELRYCASQSCNRISIEFLHQGLHEFPSRLNSKLREAVLNIKEESCDYILLNYGLCGNGTLEISHPSIPMIIHNVHDCIPVLVGDFSLHREYMKKRPGTFWFSCGWIEGFPLPGSPDYVERYREFYNISITEKQMDIIERMLMENYTNLTFIRWDELGERLATYCREYTKSCVTSINRRLGLNFVYDEVKGDPALLQRFVDGNWGGDEFLIIEPGKKLRFDAERCSLCTGN
mgnify:CR=1 FL=1